MGVRCTKCGEELLGAVNRCWRCGQKVAAHADAAAPPTVRPEILAVSTDEPLDAVVLEDGAAATTTAIASGPPVKPPRPLSTAERIDAKRKSLMAMGGTVGSLVLGSFALALAAFRFEAALIALMGLVMGIWGLYSPRRRLALFAMLLCWLGIGVGTYTGVRQLYIHILKNRPVVANPDTTP